MTSINHSAAQAGSRHAIDSLVYANRTAREGASGLTAADLYRVAYETATGTYWLLTDYTGPIVWKQILVCRAADTLKLDIQEGGIFRQHVAAIELADSDTYDFGDFSAGFGSFMLIQENGGPNSEMAKIFWNNGTIDDEYLSANSSLSDTPGKFCLLSSGSGIQLKNNMGYDALVIMNISYVVNLV